MADLLNVKSLGLPVTMVVTMAGSMLTGSTWLQSIRSDVDHMDEKRMLHNADFREFKTSIKGKIQTMNDMGRSQDERLSRMEGKQDLILESIRRLNNMGK